MLYISEPLLADAFVEFDRRVQEAQSWCVNATMTHPRTDLRRLPNPVGSSAQGLLQLAPEALVFGLCIARRRALGGAAPSVSAGRLLAYFPDADTCDGTPEAASQGLFDSCGTPPWDTWIGFYGEDSSVLGESYRRYCISWMPEVFHSLVDRAIAQTVDRSIAWLDETETAVARSLAAR